MVLRTVLTTPAYLGMLVLVGGAAALLFYIAWRCLNGDSRTWAVLPPLPFQIAKHNTWPFMLLMIGITLLTALPSVFFEATRMEGARVATWNVVLIPLALVVLSFLWWPLAWTPRWFRTWAARNNRGATPWTMGEVERVKAAPDSRRRQRALTDIARLVGEDEVAGLRDKSLLDREVERIEDYNERLGITGDMDTIERARIIKAHRRRQKEQKKADRQAAKRRQG
ncbi:hypothetical protein AB0K08_12050 [Citricoccus sp. NPDC055426]|uniref:hypothetical protein n=1 Tax=Citricoccus sp. NPDC055426 TaxID=3155536 RepID=UPI0034344632